MKKFYLIFVASIILGFTSCEKPMQKSIIEPIPENTLFSIAQHGDFEFVEWYEGLQDVISGLSITEKASIESITYKEAWNFHKKNLPIKDSLRNKTDIDSMWHFNTHVTPEFPALYRIHIGYSGSDKDMTANRICCIKLADYL